MKIYSDGFKSLNLPNGVVQQIATHAKRQRVYGKGSFCYLPMDIHCPDGSRASIVVAMFDKAVRQENIQANPGDESFSLRAEWNVKENPLD
jgi:hypothetical protein